MKISLLSGITRNAGGLFYAVSSLCKAMGGQHVDISVFGRADDLHQGDLKTWEPVPVFDYKAYGPLGWSFKLRRLLKYSDADLVHQHGLWMDDQWAALQWQKQNRKSVVISPHGMLDPWAVKNSAWKKKLVGWLFANESLRKASCIHALCQSEADSIRAYGLKSRIAVLPNGIDLPTHNDFVQPPWQGNIENGRKVLLYLGRLHPKKGLSNLLTAWKQAKEKTNSDDWTLALVGWGQGGHEDELKEHVAALGLEQEVVFLGSQFGEAKAACYHHADAFVLPSFSEGLPMVVLEAWAHGLPVLMTPQCNIPEGFAAEAAIRIEPNPADVASGLLALFSMNNADRIQMGQRGLALVKEKFTWTKIAAEMEAVYQWVLGGGQAPDCVRFD